MKVLSLFDGISGCQQALKNLGIEFDNINNIYCASEVDRNAIQITQKNFPNTIQLGDVRAIKNKPIIEHSLEQTGVDMQGWAIGTPVYTLVGHEIKGEKQSIYYKQDIDLLCGGSPCQDLSCAKKDRKGLDGERSGLFYEYIRILKEVKPKFFILENVASMSKESKESISKELFNIESILINSSLLTAQQRKRLYWVGALQQDGTYKKVDIEQPKDKGILLKDIWDGGILCTNRIKKKKEGTLSYKKAFSSCRSLTNKSKCLTAAGQNISNSGATNIIIGEDYYIMSPEVCEQLQGFPKGYTIPLSNIQRYKAIGNSFTVPVIEYILKNILT